MRLGERPAEDGEVLREDVDEATIDAPVPRDDTVAIRPVRIDAEVGTAMRDEPIELDEAPLVE